MNFSDNVYYLVKPFAVDELLARIRAVSRRHQSNAASVLVFSLLAGAMSGWMAFDETRELQ